MKSDGALAPNHQDPYVRTRENPFFDGLLSKDSDETKTSKLVMDISKNDINHFQFDNSTFSEDFNYESIEHSPSENWLQTSKIAPFIQLDIQPKEEENSHAPPILQHVEKIYTVTRRKEKLANVLLPLSAASYYNGVSPEIQIVESCESIDKLNAFLKARKDDVNVGVPGKFMYAVMGSDDADVGTVASTIMYSFYLNLTSKNDQICIVPIININRANLGSHVELKWLLDSCQIDQSSLIFADEIDMSYYDLFGSLKILLLKSSKIANKQEKLKHAVVEIFHSRKGETIYSWVKNVTIGEEGSCCTAIAEKFAAYSPELLTSKSFSKLLLSGILLDTTNLRDPHCTSKDKYMASLLINGAGRYGCNGLYQLLRYKMHDLSSMQVGDILRKDFKKWKGQENNTDSRPISQIGMSCIGISIGQLLSYTENLAQDITCFQFAEKLRALIIVSGYFNEEKNFKREVLVSTESVKLLESLLFFFDFNASRLPLKILQIPGLKNEMKAYQIDKITSRKIVEHLIEEFVGIPKA
ncbi:uncharacterized protein LOC131616817 [Vicia villosa]|uniref:uncharacterized protein LOC131616817 n=1 Tax=Vicia villosa TaxID=3911 RepID=UPI00273BF23D|nr:uncharacterized protein LOC131616817 [Vicia villosa]